MSEEEKELFTDRRWTDIPMPEVIGHFEVTREEIKPLKESYERFLVRFGMLKEGEHLTDEEFYKEFGV